MPEMQDWFNTWKSIKVIHHINKLNIYPYLSPFTKLKNKSIKDLNINPTTQDLKEEKKEISLQNMGTGVPFLIWTQVVQPIRASMNLRDPLKLRNFCKSRDTIIKAKRQPSEWN